MKKFTLFVVFVSLGLVRLSAQQPQQPITRDSSAEQTMMPGQPTTTQEQAPPTQEQPSMPEQPPIQEQPSGNQSAPPPGVTLVHVNMVVLGQSNTNTNGGPVSLHFTQSTIGDNDILGLINDEFGTSFSTTNGDQLAVSNFLDGKFMVLGPTNNVLLRNASFKTKDDHYQLNFSSGNSVSASQGGANFNTNSTVIITVADGSLNYMSSDGTNSFHLAGFTTINDSYFSSLTNNAELFQLSGGIGSISFPSSNSLTGVLTGNVFGSGQNNAPTQ